MCIALEIEKYIFSLHELNYGLLTKNIDGKCTALRTIPPGMEPVGMILRSTTYNMLTLSVWGRGKIGHAEQNLIKSARIRNHVTLP